MTTKALLYLLVVPIVIWAFDSININQIFKKNRNLQAKVAYLIIIIASSYMVVNFFYDFFISTVI